MNLKTVLRTYSLLRQLTDDESALLATLRELSENERELLVESLSPQKSGKKSTKKPAAAKSSRASSLQRQLQQAPKSTSPIVPCVYDLGGQPCGATADDPIHDQSFGYGGYHEFEGGKQVVGATGG
jgi:hypothetical protein